MRRMIVIVIFALCAHSIGDAATLQVVGNETTAITATARVLPLQPELIFSRSSSQSDLMLVTVWNSTTNSGNLRNFFTVVNRREIEVDPMSLEWGCVGGDCTPENLFRGNVLVRTPELAFIDPNAFGEDEWKIVVMMPGVKVEKDPTNGALRISDTTADGSGLRGITRIGVTAEHPIIPQRGNEFKIAIEVSGIFDDRGTIRGFLRELPLATPIVALTRVNQITHTVEISLAGAPASGERVLRDHNQPWSFPEGSGLTPVQGLPPLLNVEFGFFGPIIVPSEIPVSTLTGSGGTTIIFSLGHISSDGINLDKRFFTGTPPDAIPLAECSGGWACLPENINPLTGGCNNLHKGIPFVIWTRESDSVRFNLFSNAHPTLLDLIDGLGVSLAREFAPGSTDIVKSIVLSEANQRQASRVIMRLNPEPIPTPSPAPTPAAPKVPAGGNFQTGLVGILFVLTICLLRRKNR